MLDIDVKFDKIKDKDEDKIISAINQVYDADVNNKNLRAAVWSQNLHFYAGDQWIKYSETDRQWKSIPVTRLNKAIDRPITNIILTFITTNASSFTNKPIITIDPNSDDPKDKMAAKAAEVVSEYLWEECDKLEDYYEAALWMLNTGDVFRKSSKISTGQSLRIPMRGEGDEILLNPATKRKLTQKVDMKKVAVEIVSPFNITFDGLPKRFKDIRVIMQSEFKSLDWIEAVYGKEAKDDTGYTGRAEEVKEEDALNNVLTIGEGLKNLVEGNNQSGFAYQSSQSKNAAVVKELYTAPTKNFPKGRMLVATNNVLLYRGPSPYYYLSGKRWHPFTHCNYLKMPGSIWGVSMTGQLIPKQRSINSIDALVAYNRKTVAVPKWLIPVGCGVPDDSMVGTPGQEVKYNETPNGAKPEITQAAALPDQVFKEREMHMSDGERLANNAGLRQGFNPQGVKTIGQLQILQEQSNQAVGKPVEQWEKFIQDSEQLDLLNFQSCYLVPNPDVVQKLKKMSKDLTSFDWDAFRGVELANNTSVRVQKGSTLSQSKSILQQVILDLAQAGLLPDVMGDPYLYKTFLEKFGLADLFTNNNVDVQKAEWTIEQMMGGQYPPVLDQDNPDVQIIVIARFMKKPSFMELADPVKILFQRRFTELAQKLATANAVSDQNFQPGTTMPSKVQTPMPGQGAAGAGPGKKVTGGKRRTAIGEAT